MGKTLIFLKKNAKKNFNLQFSVETCEKHSFHYIQYGLSKIDK